MMTVQIRYFASVREVMGCASEIVQTPATTLAELRDALVARGGVSAQALARTQPVRMALNRVMAAESAFLTPGGEVAFFPPVTGG
jgi:sulfur-carrier protein